MRVALIDTMDKAAGGGMPSPAIASLASYLFIKGHEVGVLDLFFSDAKTQHRFFRQEWGLIGITATSFAFPVCRQVGKTIRQIAPKTLPPIVVGGPHVSVAREDVFTESWLDFAIYGEGEIPLLSLVELLEKEGRPSVKCFKKIAGLIFRNGHNVVVNPPQARIKDIDTLPLPQYDLFPMESYRAHFLSTSRGCPFSCVYCASTAIFGKTWVAKKPQRIVKEIEYVITGWGNKPFQIIDDTFNLKEQRVKEFCQLLIDKGMNIQWAACGIRADKTDPEMLCLMKKSGCNSVCVGIESANPQVLKNIGKKETIEQITEGINRIKKVGIKITGMFMIGNPGDRAETVMESIEFSKSLPLDMTRFYMAVPFPNTKLWQFVEEQGQFLHRDYENFHDYSEEPLFETDDFTYQERIESYKAAKEVMFTRKHRLHRLIMKKFTLLCGRARKDGAIPALRQVLYSIARRCQAKLCFVRSRRLEVEDNNSIKTRFSRQ